MTFDLGHATHWLYLDPIGIVHTGVGKEENQTVLNESDIVALSDSRRDEPEIVESEALIIDNDPSIEDLGVGLNDQWDEQEIAASSQDRWEEPDRVKGGELIVERESELEEFDFGISTNDQWEEPVKIERKELIVEREIIPEPEPAPQPMVRPVSVVEAEVEAALEASEPELSTINPQPSTEEEFSEKSYRQNNLVLLLDVSASMKKEDKMIKLKSTIKRVVGMLRSVDVLTIIAYNIRSWEVLPPTSVSDNEMIISMIDTLTPFGYTNGVQGMEQAYASLKAQFIPGGNNQLILATDGKFNSSKFSEKDALDLVMTNAGGGSVLSIIGFGEDKEATRMMKKMAKAGEGNFLQIKGGEDPTELLAEEIKMRSRR